MKALGIVAICTAAVAVGAVAGVVGVIAYSGWHFRAIPLEPVEKRVIGPLKPLPDEWVATMLRNSRV